MNLKEAIHFLQKKLNEIPKLKKMKYGNQEYDIWHKDLGYELKRQFTRNSEQHKIIFGDRNFPKPLGFSRDPVKNEIYQQQVYLDDLNDLETGIRTLLQILKREKKKYDTELKS